MNIFVLDADPILAARYHHDKHVVKMILETAQLLSTASPFPGCYKPTHINHPCTKWVAESNENYSWLWQLGIALGNEYTYRYGKQHKSHEVIRAAGRHLGSFITLTPKPTPFAQAMPKQYKHADAVTAYRNYYIGEKVKQSKWTNRPTPEWLT